MAVADRSEQVFRQQARNNGFTSVVQFARHVLANRGKFTPSTIQQAVTFLRLIRTRG